MHAANSSNAERAKAQNLQESAAQHADGARARDRKVAPHTYVNTNSKQNDMQFADKLCKELQISTDLCNNVCGSLRRCYDKTKDTTQM